VREYFTFIFNRLARSARPLASGNFDDRCKSKILRFISIFIYNLCANWTYCVGVCEDNDYFSI